jgi:hypothetical protein
VRACCGSVGSQVASSACHHVCAVPALVSAPPVQPAAAVTLARPPCSAVLQPCMGPCVAVPRRVRAVQRRWLLCALSPLSLFVCLCVRVPWSAAGRASIATPCQPVLMLCARPLWHCNTCLWLAALAAARVCVLSLFLPHADARPPWALCVCVPHVSCICAAACTVSNSAPGTGRHACLRPRAMR